MATQTGGKTPKTPKTPKTRKTIKTQTMRELMFASGGRCAMTECGLSLISPTGGWIGTIAHIIGAEKAAPRGAGPETPDDRALSDNLLLMCATHGREVDAPETGEANFPIDNLRMMKRAHEAKITDAVKTAIDEEVSGVQTATGSIDTTLRLSNAAASADGLLESMGFAEGDDIAQIVNGLSEARLKLRRLSQSALDTLSQLLGLWLQQCKFTKQSADGFDFGDPGGQGPQLPFDVVENRVIRSRQDAVEGAMQELKIQDLLSVEVDDDENGPTVYYYFSNLWTVSGFDFWRCAAQFLYDGHGVELQDWIKGLDFSIFDRVAAPDRDVAWR